MLTIRRLGYALGAEVTGLDLLGALDAQTVERIREAWLEHIVLCFPSQDMGPEDLKAFCARLGTLDDNRRNPHLRHPDYPEVFVLSNRALNVNGKQFAGGIAGGNWHSDLCYTNRPAEGSFLVVKELPDVGGDTLFANMYAAYDALSPVMKALLEPLNGVHTATLGATYGGSTPEVQEQFRRLNPPISHPIVVTHPETGRKALYVNDLVGGIAGMRAEEAKPLLRFLVQHATRYEFVYRHCWHVNDLVMWDNRCALHHALRDYDQRQRRRGIRCATMGPTSGVVYETLELAGV